MYLYNYLNSSFTKDHTYKEYYIPVYYIQTNGGQISRNMKVET